MYVCTAYYIRYIIVKKKGSNSDLFLLAFLSMLLLDLVLFSLCIINYNIYIIYKHIYVYSIYGMHIAMTMS